MRWLLDTNAVIDAFAGKADAVKALAKARSDAVEWVGYSAMTRLEILGFAALSAADEKGLRELLAEFTEVHIAPAVIDEAIRVRKAIRIKIPDAIIAATALVHQAEVVSRNTTDFRGVAGLKVIDLATL
jgi:hypothetical protein